MEERQETLWAKQIYRQSDAQTVKARDKPSCLARRPEMSRKCKGTERGKQEIDMTKEKYQRNAGRTGNKVIRIKEKWRRRTERNLCRTEKKLRKKKRKKK